MALEISALQADRDYIEHRHRHKVHILILLKMLDMEGLVRGRNKNIKQRIERCRVMTVMIALRLRLHRAVGG